MNEIGKNIRKLREEKKLTQEELAEKMHITRQSVSNYETSRSRPDVEMLKMLAEALDTDIETILYGKPKETAAFLDSPDVRANLFKIVLSFIVTVILFLIRMRLLKKGILNDTYRPINLGICTAVLIPLSITVITYYGGKLFTLMGKKKISEKYRKPVHIVSLAVIALTVILLMTGAYHMLQTMISPAYHEITFDGNGMQISSLPDHNLLSEWYLWILYRYTGLFTLVLCMIGFLAGMCPGTKEITWKWNILPVILCGLVYLRLFIPALSLKAHNDTTAYYTASNTKYILTFYKEENGILKKQLYFNSSAETGSHLWLQYQDGMIEENSIYGFPYYFPEDESGMKFSFRRFVIPNKTEKILVCNSSYHGTFVQAKESPPEGLIIVTVRKGY